MWRRVSLAAQIRSIECQLSSLWRLRTIQYLMELAQPFNTHCHLIGGKPPTSSVARCEVESCATFIGGVYGATDFSLVLQENIPATEGSKTFSLSIYRQLAQACSKPLPIQSQTDSQPATPHSTSPCGSCRPPSSTKACFPLSRSQISHKALLHQITI
jgi:hypothetical protein